MDVIDLLQRAQCLLRQHVSLALPVRHVLAFDYFGHMNAHIAQTLLEILEPQLSEAEKLFVHVWGPEIYGHYVRHAHLTWIDRHPEEGEEGRAGDALKAIANRKLTGACIRKEKRMLLDGLLRSAVTNGTFPPQTIQDIYNYLGYSRQELTQWHRVAQELNAPSYIVAFLADMLLCEI